MLEVGTKFGEVKFKNDRVELSYLLASCIVVYIILSRTKH